MTHFIVNPASGGGLRAVPLINAFMERTGAPYLLKYTEGPSDAKRLARESALSGAALIVAVGGDGTVQEVLSGFMEYRERNPECAAALGILPAGSGNDAYCSIKGGKKLNSRFEERVNDCLKSVFSGDNRVIDVIKAGGEYMLNIGSAGIDAEIVKTAVRLKKVFGRFSYIAATVIKSITYKAGVMKILADGADLNAGGGKTLLAAACNGKYYGGGFVISPAARPDDGLITLCHIDGMPNIKVLALFPRVLRAVHVKMKEVHFINCRTVEIELPENGLLNLDGNLFERSSVVKFEIMPGALKVAV